MGIYLAKRDGRPLQVFVLRIHRFPSLAAWSGIKRGDEFPIYSLNILVNLIDSD